MIYKRKEGDLLVSLLACALGGNAPALPDGVDWDNLFSLAALQKVEGMAAHALSRTPRVPQNVLQKFEAVYRKEIAAHMILHNEGVKILNAFEVNGVDCVPLKGWVLQDLYPNPAMRYMCDMDVLFKPEQSGDVQRVLEALDYIPQELGGNPEVYYKKPVMNIEMHKRLVRDDTGHFDSTWDRVQPLPHCDHTFAMTHEDFYLYMLAHLHKHFIGGGTGVRYVCDAELFLGAYGQQLDRDYVDARLRQLGLLDFERRLCALCGAWFHGAPVDDALAVFADKLLFCGVFGTPERNAENQTRHAVQTMPGKSLREKKRRYALSLLFPPLAVMRDVYPALQKAPFLLPVFWAVRGVHRLFTGHDHARRLLERAGSVTEEDLRHDF